MKPAAPQKPAADAKAVVDYLQKEKKSARGNTQGCGCLIIVLGLVLAVLFPPFGIFLALVGVVVLIYGLIR